MVKGRIAEEAGTEKFFQNALMERGAMFLFQVLAH